MIFWIHGGGFVNGGASPPTHAAYRANAFAHVPMMIGATSADIGGKTGPMIAGARNLETVIAARGVPVQQGAGHASDIPFFFNTQAVKYEADTTPRDNAMGKAISAYLANFAKTGNPDGAGLPVWPRYQRARDEIMDFAASGRAEPGKDGWGTELDAAAH